MRYDNDRLVYLAYHKLYSKVSSKKLREHKRSMRFGLDKGLPTVELTLQSNDPNLDADYVTTRLRDLAPKQISKISKSSVNFTPTRQSYTGAWLEVSGTMYEMIRSHDDYRVCESKAPSIVVWFTCISNGDGTCTHLLFHGTPEQNLSSLHLNALPRSRSGSCTEKVFELLYAEASSTTLEGKDTCERDANELIEKANWIVEVSPDYNKGDFEILANITLDLHASTEMTCCFIRSSSSNSLVTRMLIASPIIVQRMKQL